MNDQEAFLIFLSYLLPFGGITNLIIGTAKQNILRIVVGIICVLATLLIMGYLIYKAKKEKLLLTKNAKKIKLLIDIFRQILASCILVIAEFLILWSLGIEIRQTLLIICISLIIMTIIANFLKKL